VIEDLARTTGLTIEEADASFLQERATLPLAQNRTSSNKAFVYVRGNEIIKGPYPSHSLKLLNNLRYPYLIQALEASASLPPCRLGALAWQKLLRAGGSGPRSYYLAAGNVGQPEQLRTVESSTRIDANFRLAERGSFVERVSEREKVKRGGRYERHPDFDEEVAVASLQHLYFRFLLDVGDSGTHNILMRADRATSGRPIAGIDFDEQRSPQERRTVLGHFFKQEHGYLEAVYGGMLERIVWLEELPARAEEAIGEVKALCERWVKALPANRLPLSESVLRAEDVLARNERLRSLRRRGR
jgi:hypothetical protein